MSTQSYHLAQINIGQLRAPLTDPLIKEFVDNLDPINALAEQSPGFIWRLQTEEGDATALRPYENELIIVNMSVWEDVEALKAYVYKSNHVDFVRRRKEWFEKMELFFCMWWIPAGHIPTVDEGKAKLAQLTAEGESDAVFTFRNPALPPQPSAMSIPAP